MCEEKIAIKDIHEAYKVFSFLIRSEDLCANNQSILSSLAFQIDSYALATIINFFNKHPEVNSENWQSSLLIIRMLSVVTSESLKYLTNKNYLNTEDYKISNNFEDIISLRNKIHQYRYQDFKTNINNIDEEMGRSRNFLKPHLDICLQYEMVGKETLLTGTNIYFYHFKEAREQNTIDLMKSIIRTVEKNSSFPPASFEILKGVVTPIYKWTPYCYTDIIKNANIKNGNLLDRILLAFDDLCAINEFFTITINTSEYLKNAPYIIYYFIKMISVILDETFDNLHNFVRWGKKSKDAMVIEEIITNINLNSIDFYKKVRNNIHYDRQESIPLKNEYELLQKGLETVSDLIQKFKAILNINPSKLRLGYYRFLRWAQEPINKK